MLTNNDPLLQKFNKYLTENHNGKELRVVSNYSISKYRNLKNLVENWFKKKVVEKTGWKGVEKKNWLKKLVAKTGRKTWLKKLLENQYEKLVENILLETKLWMEDRSWHICYKLYIFWIDIFVTWHDLSMFISRALILKQKIIV